MLDQSRLGKALGGLSMVEWRAVGVGMEGGHMDSWHFSRGEGEPPCGFSSVHSVVLSGPWVHNRHQSFSNSCRTHRKIMWPLRTESDLLW